MDRCEVEAACRVGIEVRGPGAAVSVREGRVRNSAGRGVVISDGATGTFERVAGAAVACEIRDVGSDGIVLNEEADPVVRRCTVIRAAGHGVAVHGQSRGAFTDCAVMDGAAAGVLVAGASDPVFSQCRVEGSAKAALVVTEAAAGTFDQAELRGSGHHGIEIRAGANPLLRRAAVVGCGGHGLTVLDDGRGRIEDSVVEAAEAAGMHSASGGYPDVRGTRFRAAPMRVCLWRPPGASCCANAR